MDKLRLAKGRGFWLGVVVIALLLPVDGQARYKFTGFTPGAQSVGFLLGSPLKFQYEWWTHRANSYSVDFGLHWNGALQTGFNYNGYLLNESDHWFGQKGYGAFLARWLLGGVVVVNTNSEEDTFSGVGGRLGMGFDYILPSQKWVITGEVLADLFVVGPHVAALEGGIGMKYVFGNRRLRKVKKQKD
ncbi:MAG: hypothetical protein H6626_01510 [Pseudobdellovibrionaceae bacterium]|nr:MAG: hypothetical protein H6626_01510 [Pseudobdellovibrionaceae bacterium]